MQKWLLFVFLCFSSCAQAMPLIGIIIDDMGNHAQLDSQVVNLPGPVTCSIIPYTYYSVWIAERAHAANKEVIAHIPMQAIGAEYLGRGGLNTSLTQQQFDQVLINDLRAVPYAEGLNNHMGSLLTQQYKQMDWLMQFIQPTGLFYVDSRTSPRTIAETVAEADDVPTLRRNVFLDDNPTPAAISMQFTRLLVIAKHQGMAIAIGHPYPATINFLQRELPLLQQQGVELVPLSQLVVDKEYSERLAQVPVKASNPILHWEL